MSQIKTAVWVFLMVCVAPMGFARGQREGVVIAPQYYLRGYDPITVTFPNAVGPPEGGPVQDPGPYLHVSPEHPGEFRWTDRRTLQFQPATPWPALARYEVSSGALSMSLTTMMVPPIRISPANGSSNLEPLQRITLFFPYPLEALALQETISFEIRSLPGIGEVGSYWLTKQDFNIKQLDRASQAEDAIYVLTLQRPVEYGKRVSMHLRLSLDERLTGSLAEYAWSTKPDFRFSGMGAGYTTYPVASNGSVYALDQAIDAGEGRTPLFLEFSEPLSPVDVQTLKRLVRFQPAVDNLQQEVSDNRLYLYFDAERETPYQLSVEHQAITSENGRLLAPFKAASLYFYYRQLPPYLRWQSSQAIVERHGPHVYPMEGRALDRIDLRIYEIDPLDRNFWPYPENPVVVNEARRPSMPGEEPAAGTQLEKQIQLLASPAVSRLVTLPLDKQAGQTGFGLDLDQFLDRPTLETQGAYLLGYRVLGTSNDRVYVRLLVTDLCLTTVEEEHAVNFVVTSIETARPISGARVTVEGDFGDSWQPVIKGITDHRGMFRYSHREAIKTPLTRIVVSHADDVLVLDPDQPPPHFQNNHWFGSASDWLAWLNRDPVQEKDKPRHRGHILTERPVYRPEETVHILGYVRQRHQGRILKDDPTRERSVIVQGPGRKQWTFPVDIDQSGMFHLAFSGQQAPSGQYTALLREDETGTTLSSVTFKKEAYRVPRFEVNITGPDKVPIDKPFELVMVADFYAGGRVVGQEVTWQITQYPHQITPPAYAGYVFSTDERFSGQGPFRAIGGSYEQDLTDDNGSAQLTIDPAVEEDGRPRRYAVEATVRGADTQTVTAVKQVVALPPFILGISSARLVDEGMTIRPKIIVLDHTESPLAGKPYTLRLYRREWHSYLIESDIATGSARYMNDVVDSIVFENDYVSQAGATEVELAIETAGVYVIELLARDNLGRLQRVQTDVYVPGEQPVAWEKTEANVFESLLDDDRYQPGDVLQLLLKSPFQNALALTIVETPTENQYHWVEIKNGQGLFSMPVTKEMTPGFPIHTLLMRGRVADTGRTSRGKIDPGKPTAMANTTWVNVEPIGNQAVLRLEHEQTHLPGSTMSTSILLADPEGVPLDGRVALWLVDRAVLALGTEKRLDPLPAFIDPARARIRIRETRNEVVGNLLTEEIPAAGDFEAEAEPFRSILEEATVRRTFKTVAYFNPQVEVVNGHAEIQIDLPDNLTEFAVRAIATAGFDRFAVAKSVVSVRLPVIVQSALPRFVRPGDRFVAGGIGRVVEGAGGPGHVELQVVGVRIEGNDDAATVQRPLTWEQKRPQQLYFPFDVPRQLSEEDGVTIRMAVVRESDGALDAFEVELPVRRDTNRRRLDVFAQIQAEAEIAFPAPEEPIRPGTLRQTATITYEPALVSLIGALQSLVRYEYSCAEQRVSRLYPGLALQAALERIGLAGELLIAQSEFQDAFTYLESCLQPNGLFAFWPGSRGYVGLTAYVVGFLSQAQQNGYLFDESLLARPLEALKQALRSDYPNFVAGMAFRERTEALVALAGAGFFDQAYAQDLLVGALTSDLYTRARILYLFLAGEAGPPQKAVTRLLESLWQSAAFKLREGTEVFAGLTYQTSRWGGPTLSSDLQTLAMVTRSLYRAEPGSPRVRLMLEEIVARGGADGWGGPVSIRQRCLHWRRF